jgi:hypothetical protein
MHERFDRMNERFDGMNQHFELRLDQMSERMLVQTRWLIGSIALFGTIMTHDGHCPVHALRRRAQPYLDAPSPSSILYFPSSILHRLSARLCTHGSGLLGQRAQGEMRNPDPTYRTLCRLLSGQACPEFYRRADTALMSTFGPDDWRVLAATARREGVAPLLYYRLNQTGWLDKVPSDVQADLRQAYYATTAHNLLTYRELSRLLTALSHIPVIVLKGAALAATLYPSIGLRPIGDLDLLVPKERLAEALAHLKALGYVQPYPEMAPGLDALAGHHVDLQGGRDIHLAVELHWTFHWTIVGGKRDWRSPSIPWFWDQTEPLVLPAPQSFVPPATVLTFTPTAHLLYLCAHLMLQHGEDGSVLRWFYDIYLLIEREGQRIQWDELVARAVEFRWAPAVYAALEGVCDRFCDSSDREGDTWLPPEALETLAEVSDLQPSRLVANHVDSHQARAMSVVAVASALSPRARLRLLLATAIPSPVYVRWRYKPRPSWLWPLCYLYRWLDILREGLTTLWRIASRRASALPWN